MTSWINPKVTVRSAGKKGLGSFANAPIAKGEIVVVQGGRIMSYKTIMESSYRSFCDHCFQVEKDLLICPTEPTKETLDGVFQINHSCDPTCGFKGQAVLVAMRDIQPREEVTYDYAMTDANHRQVTCAEMTCLCGAPSCRKVVTGEDWQRQDLQQKYEGYFSTFIQELIESA